MPKEQEYSVSYRSNGKEVEGYGMVQGHVGVSYSHLPGVWVTSSTLQSDIHLAYSIKGELSGSQTSQGQLHDLLYALSSAMGVWESEDDEDLPGGNGDSGED